MKHKTILFALLGIFKTKIQALYHSFRVWMWYLYQSSVWIRIQKKLQKMKESIKISILSVIVGSFQMILFLPNGYSCIDGKSDIITGIFHFMPIQFCLVFLYSIIFKPIEKPIAKYILLLIVLAFWLYANKVEFSHRYACWSTYSEEEININVLYKSIIPCVICIFSFYMGIYYFEKRKKRDIHN